MLESICIAQEAALYYMINKEFNVRRQEKANITAAHKLEKTPPKLLIIPIGKKYQPAC